MQGWDQGRYSIQKQGDDFFFKSLKCMGFNSTICDHLSQGSEAKLDNNAFFNKHILFVLNVYMNIYWKEIWCEPFWKQNPKNK